MRGSILCGLFLACLVAVVAESTQAQAQAHNQVPDSADSSPDASRAPYLVEAVVHTTIRPPNLDIYLFERPGETPRRLAQSPALEYNATFSPDGRWIVFTSGRAGGGDLFAIDLTTGGEAIRLTQHEAFDDAAAFSPDGSRLVFVSTRDGDADIFAMPFVPSNPAAAEAQAVNLTKRPGGDLNPAFSPDGERIAYSRQDVLWNPGYAAEGPTDFSNTHTDVYVMDADGSNPVRLTEPGAMAGTPAWSPDGEFFYYYRLEDPGFFDGGFEREQGLEIRRIAANGTGDIAIAPFGLSPAVTPGGRLAFMRPQVSSDYRATLERGSVVSVTAEGTDLRVESDPGRNCHAPAFDPSSERMACHGPAPLETLPHRRLQGYGDFALAPPGARRRVELPDRTLAVHGILGMFPAVLPNGEVAYSIFGRVTGGARTVPLEVSNLDGSLVRTLFSRSDAIVWAPFAARDSGWIAVAVGPPDGPDEPVGVWKVRIDGSEATSLTPDSPVSAAFPSISADGRRIVFRRGDSQFRNIYMMDGDGGNLRPLTQGRDVETMPALSPNGEWVVFSTMRAPIFKLWIQRIGGTEGRFLEPDRVDIPDLSMHPRFSPDGRWVVFTSDRGHMNDEWPLTAAPQPYGDLWAVPITGGTAVRLTDDKWEDGPSDWGFVRIPQ